MLAADSLQLAVRAITAQRLRSFLTLLGIAVGIAAVILLTSPEFESRPLTFRGYVGILYRAFLAREPDPAGGRYHPPAGRRGK